MNSIARCAICAWRVWIPLSRRSAETVQKQTGADDKLKQRAKSGAVEVTGRLYVLDSRQHDVHRSSLREEISAVLAVASAQDEVLLRLEKPWRW